MRKTEERGLRKLLYDKKGQGAFLGIILMAAGLVALVAIFAIAPLIGYSLDRAAPIPGKDYARGTLAFTGDAEANTSVNISTETYYLAETWQGGGHVKWLVCVDSLDAAKVTANLTNEINTNSTKVTAVDNGDNSATVTAKILGIAGNSYPTTTNLTNAAWGAATLTGGSEGSHWNSSVNPAVPTGLSIWTTNAPLLILVVTVSILVMVIGAIMTFGQLGRRGRD